MIYDNISIKYDPVNKNSLWRTFNDKFLPKIEGESIDAFKKRLEKSNQSIQQEIIQLRRGKREIFSKIIFSYLHSNDSIINGSNTFMDAITMLDSIAQIVPNIGDMESTLSSIDVLESSKRNLEKEITIVKNIQLSLIYLDQINSIIPSIDRFDFIRLSTEDYRQICPLCEYIQEFLSPIESLRDYNPISTSLFNTFDNILSILESAFLEELETCMFLLKGTIRDNRRYDVLLFGLKLFSHYYCKDKRSKIQQIYNTVQLQDYKNRFKPIGINDTLSDFFVRCEWLERRISIIIQDHSSVFPSSWNILEQFTGEVILLLYTDIQFILSHIITPEQSSSLIDLLKIKRYVDTFEQNLEQSFNQKSRVLSDMIEKHLGILGDIEEQSLRQVMEKLTKSNQLSQDSGVDMRLTSCICLFQEFVTRIGHVGAVSNQDFYVKTCNSILVVIGEYMKYVEKEYSRLSFNITRYSLVVNSVIYAKQALQDMNQIVSSHLSISGVDSHIVPFDSMQKQLALMITRLTSQLVNNIEESLTVILESFPKKKWNIPSNISGCENDTHKHTTCIQKAHNCMKQYLIQLKDNLHQESRQFVVVLSKISEMVGHLLYIIVWKCKKISISGAILIRMEFEILFQLMDSRSWEDTKSTKDKNSCFFKEVIDLLNILICESSQMEGFIEKYLSMYPDGNSKHLSKILELKNTKNVHELIEVLKKRQ